MGSKPRHDKLAASFVSLNQSCSCAVFACAAGDGNMHIGLKVDRIKCVQGELGCCTRSSLLCIVARRYWLTAGAVPTSKVQLLLGRVGVVPQLPKPPVVAVRNPEDEIKWQSKLKKS